MAKDKSKDKKEKVNEKCSECNGIGFNEENERSCEKCGGSGVKKYG